MQTTSVENNKSIPTDLLIIAALWIVSIVIVNPIGEFPLNDDWAVAQTVKYLVETGSYSPSPWLAMTLITNVLWGALFCVPFGFSFTALRISTLVISLIGMLAVYWIGRDLKLQRPLRIVAALALGFNPLYFALSNSFMTDVPFTVLLIVSALFFVRCLKDDSNSALYLGIGIAVAATLSRQLGIAIPLAFAVAYIFRFGFSFRSIFRGTIPLIICVAVLLAFEHWLRSTGRMPPIYLEKSTNLIAVLKNPKLLLLRELLSSYVSLVYFGLFLLPGLILLIPAMASEHTRRNASLWLAAIVAGGLTWFISAAVHEPLLPMFGNVLSRAGIGPFTLRDTYILGESLPELPNRFWVAVTWVGIAGTVLIFAAIALFLKQALRGLRFGRTSFEIAASVFLLLCPLVYLFPLFTNAMFDRYLIPALPFFMLAFMSLYTGTEVAKIRSFQYLGFAAVLVVSLFSIALTKDYLTWNQVRWQATNDLTQIQKLSAAEIDGGFEFNGWNSYDPNYAVNPSKSWWWIQRDTYLISSHSVPGYYTSREYNFRHLLPPYTGKLLILQQSSVPELIWPTPN